MPCRGGSLISKTNGKFHPITTTSTGVVIPLNAQEEAANAVVYFALFLVTRVTYRRPELVTYIVSFLQSTPFCMSRAFSCWLPTHPVPLLCVWACFGIRSRQTVCVNARVDGVCCVCPHILNGHRALSY